ncbi:hypothetical protein QA601_17315 [Chitinispirillales bacterium ANBcel5]|uniref:phosphoenolpyruvate-utilizing N-terminal domain-containing protein n=1 Tax=Cellulosispirillum alkaliphilum TaxID=3039283 RepID=UPI002A4F770D|nr:hypothetical protein [Chitinispirillales bacterium ANBcel5]
MIRNYDTSSTLKLAKTLNKTDHEQLFEQGIGSIISKLESAAEALYALSCKREAELVKKDLQRLRSPGFVDRYKSSIQTRKLSAQAAIDSIIFDLADNLERQN